MAKVSYASFSQLMHYFDNLVQIIILIDQNTLVID